MQILASIYDNKNDNYILAFILRHTFVSWNSQLASGRAQCSSLKSFGCLGGNCFFCSRRCMYGATGVKSEKQQRNGPKKGCCGSFDFPLISSTGAFLAYFHFSSSERNPWPSMFSPWFVPVPLHFHHFNIWSGKMLAFKPEQDISDANHAFTNVSITSH